MKKCLSVLLATVLLLTMIPLGAISVSAATYEYGDLYYTINNGKVTITGYTDEMPVDLVIPDTIEGYPVTFIGDSAFIDCTNLTSVTIPNSVTTIDDFAFDGCTNLASMIIGNNVTTIGKYAFVHCSSLIRVSIPASVTTIGDGAFSSNTLIYCNRNTAAHTWVQENGRPFVLKDGTDEESIVGGKVGEITWSLDKRTGHLMFTGNGNMIDFNSANAPWKAYNDYIFTADILDNITSIGKDAFSDCTNLIMVTIPDSVTSIGNYAFYNCYNLTSVTIPDSVISIGENAFYYCSSLTSVTIGDGVTSIGYGAFFDCSNLTSVTIPGSVTSIGERAFYWCTSLTSVTIPDSVTSIGKYAFSGCSSLTSVTIPDSVTSIGDGAFYGCFSLTAINVDSKNSQYISEDGVLFNKNKTSLICCPGGKIGAYVIPDSVTSIGNSAFFYCASLTSVTIPDSVTSIGDEAFSYCTSLTSVTIPDSVTFIGDEAFSYCSSLTSVAIGDSVTSIGEHAFSNCASLTSVTIPDSVTSIGDCAFFYCNNLTSVTIPDSVTSIGDGAFYWCSSLTDVYYGGSEKNKAQITIGAYNDELVNATWHYADDAISNEVTHSVMDTEKGNGLAFRFELSANGIVKDNRNLMDLTGATINYLGVDCKLIGMGSVITNSDAKAENLTLDTVNDCNVVNVPTVYLQEAEEGSCAFATRIVNIPDDQMERTLYARPYFIVEVDGEKIIIYGDVNATSCADCL